MRLYSKAGLWSIAELWYLFIALIGGSMLANGLQHGWDELLFVVRNLRPMGWVIVVAAVAPGPLAHWLSRKVKE